MYPKYNCLKPSLSSSTIYLQIGRCIQLYLQPTVTTKWGWGCFAAAALSITIIIGDLQLVHWPTKTQGLEWGPTDWLLTSAHRLASCLHCAGPSRIHSSLSNLIHLNLFVFDTLFHSLCLSVCWHTICFDLALFSCFFFMACNCLLACWVRWNGGQVVVASCVTCRQMPASEHRLGNTAIQPSNGVDIHIGSDN